MPIIRLLFVWIGLALTSTALAQSPAETTGNTPACSIQESLGDVRDISCSVTASGKPMHFRFKANFSGGHDDTMASMSASLNGTALICEPGSKMQLMGEDGDVSLKCKFSITEPAGTHHLLRVLIKWSHAQYTDFEFVGE